MDLDLYEESADVCEIEELLDDEIGFCSPLRKKYSEFSISLLTGNQEARTIEVDIDNSYLEEITCPVCLEVLFQPYVMLGCLHRFCKECFHKAISTMTGGNDGSSMNHSCPSCRNKIGSRREGQPDSTFEGLIDVLSKEHIDTAVDIADLKELHDQRVADLRNQARRMRVLPNPERDKTVYFRLLPVMKLEDDSIRITREGKSEILDNFYSRDGKSIWERSHDKTDENLIDPAVNSRNNLSKQVASSELRKSYLSSPMQASIKDIKNFLKIKKEKEDISQAQLKTFNTLNNTTAFANNQTVNLSAIPGTFHFQYELFVYHKNQLRYLDDTDTLKSICREMWEWDSPLNLFFYCTMVGEI